MDTDTGIRRRESSHGTQMRHFAFIYADTNSYFYCDHVSQTISI
jgi:hypothetical protein